MKIVHLIPVFFFSGYAGILILLFLCYFSKIKLKEMSPEVEQWYAVFLVPACFFTLQIALQSSFAESPGASLVERLSIVGFEYLSGLVFLVLIFILIFYLLIIFLIIMKLAPANKFLRIRISTFIFSFLFAILIYFFNRNEFTKIGDKIALLCSTIFPVSLINLFFHKE